MCLQIKQSESDLLFEWLDTFSDIAPPQDLRTISARDDIHAYLNSPDRCPKYTEKDQPTKTSTPTSTPRRLSIPTVFLKQG